VEYQGGLILKTNAGILLPGLKLDSGIQWHYFEDSANFLEWLRTSSEDWFQTKDLKELTEPKAYLGYCRKARIYLGREDIVVRASQIDLERKSLELDEEVQVPITVPVKAASIGVVPKFRLPKSKWTKLGASKLTYTQRLQRSKDTPLIIYDRETETSWMVSELSLLLQLVYAYLAKREDVVPETRASLHSAKPLSDSGKAAHEAIKKCGRKPLWEEDEDEDDDDDDDDDDDEDDDADADADEDEDEGKKKPYRFKYLVTQFLDILDTRREEQRLKQEATLLRARTGLRGWDFVDLANLQFYFRAREVLPHNVFAGRPAWWAFGKNFQTLVIFGKGFGQVIRPDRTQINVCSSWESIPEKKDLLVASVHYLQKLSENCMPAQSSIKLTKDLTWHRPRNSRLFEDCQGGCGNPVQELLRRDGLMGGVKQFFNPANAPGDLDIEGAAVFGEPGDLEDYIREHEPCHPLNIEPQEQIENPPS
jgi:hypothetical protein